MRLLSRRLFITTGAPPARMAADTDTDDPDTEALAEAVVAELDTGTVVDDKIVVSRRGLTALIGAGLGAGALSMLGVDKATAQTAAGQVGTSSEPVDVFAAGNGTVELEGDVASTSVTGGFELTVDGDTYQFNK
jgi:hypothetical protein